jgi:hypothetical protein
LFKVAFNIIAIPTLSLGNKVFLIYDHRILAKLYNLKINVWKQKQIFNVLTEYICLFF